ncbi:MAG: hypothetical protein NVSMB51_15720 [Solirubrobacteraceae bacterium]
MATTIEFSAELAAERCRSCGTPLATDQRYCLECGEARTPFAPPVAAVAAPAPRAATGFLPPLRDNSAMAALAAIGCLLLAMGVGVLIGRSGGSRGTVTQPPAQVITLAGTGGGAASASAFANDWPAGTSGFTVQLQKLSSADGVPAAKSAATAKGAKGVGALRSDDFQGLGSGSFIVYSGVYPKQAQAQKALAKLKARFPTATVIAVKPTAASSSASSTAAGAAAQTPTSKAAPPAAVQQLNGSTGQDYVKKSKALPNKISTGGAPPKIDKTKPAGGGTGFTSIG